MPRCKKKPPENKQKKHDRVKSTKKGERKSLEKQTARIKSPYASPLCCKGLAQHELKHN